MAPTPTMLAMITAMDAAMTKGLVLLVGSDMMKFSR
jgi:hypothetical protein